MRSCERKELRRMLATRISTSSPYRCPEAVIDRFEVVNVHHRQPVLYGLTGGLTSSEIIDSALWGLLLLRPGRALVGKLLVEGLAVEQPGQRIASGIVQQALVVLVDEEHALITSSMGREGARLRDLQAGADFSCIHTGSHSVCRPGRGCARRCRPGWSRTASVRGNAPAVPCAGLRRPRVGRDQLAVLHPGACGGYGHTVVGEQLQRPHFLDAAELCRVESTDTSSRKWSRWPVISTRCCNMGFIGGEVRAAQAGSTALENDVPHPWPNRKPRFSNLVRGR